MQYKADLNEFIEALITLARNPVVLELYEVKKRRDGMPISQLIPRYEGFKDGEFLGILSSLFGLSFSAGIVNCYSGIGSSLSELLSNIYSTFAVSEAKHTLSTYLEVERLPSPEVFYWQHQLSLLNSSEQAMVRALVNLSADGRSNAKTIDEVASEVAQTQQELKVSADDLVTLAKKMPIVTQAEKGKYYLSVERWQSLQEALAAA